MRDFLGKFGLTDGRQMCGLSEYDRCYQTIQLLEVWHEQVINTSDHKCTP